MHIFTGNIVKEKDTTTDFTEVLESYALAVDKEIDHLAVQDPDCYKYVLAFNSSKSNINTKYDNIVFGDGSQGWGFSFARIAKMVERSFSSDSSTAVQEFHGNFEQAVDQFLGIIWQVWYQMNRYQKEIDYKWNILRVWYVDDMFDW